MGLFGSNKQPKIAIPEAPTLQTANNAFQNSIDFNKQLDPLALGARESALQDLNKGSAYYQQFQPTSFEKALGDQNFQNVIGDVERSIKQNLSLSGMESSPILAQQIGKARGDLGVSIGQILADLGNQRATSSLNARIGIDPNQVLQPYASTDLNQSNMQNQIDFERALMQAQANYQDQLNKYNSKHALLSATSMFSPWSGVAFGDPNASMEGLVNDANMAAGFAGMGGMGGGTSQVGFNGGAGMSGSYPNSGFNMGAGSIQPVYVGGR